MHFDFSAFLVLAAFITGIVWLLDILSFRRRRLENNRMHIESDADYLHEPVIIEYARSFFPVILLVLILRSFLFEPFKIPSGSMMPTLLIGDFILVNKFAYGVRLPVVEWEVIDTGKPEHGDPAVFRFPDDPSMDYIKRVIGLPGDEIAYINKTLAINGSKVDKFEKGEYMGEGSELYDSSTVVFEERIGQHQFDTLEQTRKLGVEGITIVPDGHYFVMGDNRDNSNDSRYWGFVPVENLVGRADRVWMSWDSENMRIRWARVGNKIK